MRYAAKVKWVGIFLIGVGLAAGTLTARRAAADAATTIPAAGMSDTARQFAALDAEVTSRREALQKFVNMHGMSSVNPQMEGEMLQKMNHELMDVQLEYILAKQHVEAVKKAAGTDVAVADAQAAVEAVQVKMEYLTKSRDAQSVKMRDLDYFNREYEGMAVELQVLEKARAELLVKKILEEAAKGGA